MSELHYRAPLLSALRTLIIFLIAKKDRGTEEQLYKQFYSY